MQYRMNPKNNQKLSILGYGCLRFTKKGGVIDQEKAEEEMKAAILAGVNYFDTAYTYTGSEICLGRFLAKGYRDQVNIATKLPHYYIKTAEDMDRYFNEQLKRLKTDRVEYYLMHMLNDAAAWHRLEQLGIKEWIRRKKEEGSILNIGFSFHGGTTNFIKLVDAYDWDFCQIQYNYADEHSQAGRRGLDYASGKGLAVIIMEPLRGGRLVQGLPASAKKVLDQVKPRRSYAQWGLRWLFDQHQVTVVLSGMNDLEQVNENIRIADQAEAGCMTAEEEKVIALVVDEINKYIKVPCTGCGYCVPCPVNVDIPGCFHAYNTSYTENWLRGVKTYFMCTALRREPTGASQCVKCGKCKAHCPQSISIPEELVKVKKRMENPLYQIVRMISRKRMKY